MSKMKMTPEERPRVKLECLRLLATLRLEPARMQLISGFVDTYLRLNAQEQAVFQEELATIRPAERERVVQIITSWMEEGIEQGLARGRQEGAKSEALTYTLRLLIHRLGNIAPATQARVSQLTVSQLENLGIAALDFSFPADLSNWLDNLPSH